MKLSEMAKVIRDGGVVVGGYELLERFSEKYEKQITIDELDCKMNRVYSELMAELEMPLGHVSFLDWNRIITDIEELEAIVKCS